MGAFDAFLGGFSGAALGRVLVEVGLNTTAMERGLATTQANLQTTGQKMGSTLKSAITVGATIAAAAVVKFGVDAVHAFQESGAVIAQTAAVLKSTGGAAGVTAEQVDALGKTLQQASLFTDEEVASAENLLLTFRNIGGNIFPQTTQAVLDMSAALGQDLKSSSIQLGKALNDPIVGLTALRRVGVSFSDEQVALITHLVETNDLLGAQKIILAEVGAEFGGSAQAAEDAAGPFADIADSMDAFQEAAGQAIVGALKPMLPLLATLLKLLVPLIPAIEAVVAGFLTMTIVSGLSTALLSLSIVLEGLPAVFAVATAATFELAAAMETLAGPIGIAVAALVLFISQADGLAPALDEIVQKTIDAAEAATLAAKEHISLADAMKLVEGPTKTAANAFDDLKTHINAAGKTVRNFAGLTGKELKDWKAETTQNFGTVEDVFTSLQDKARVTASGIVKAFNKQINAQKDYLKDLAKLKKEGREVPDAVLQALSTMGLDGADAIHVLRTASDRDFKAIVKKAEETADLGKTFPGKFQKVGTSFDSTGGHVDTLNGKLNDTKTKLDALTAHTWNINVVYHATGTPPTPPGGG